ncbi:hypothetical protein BCR42DRAFT_452483 [Absidia repens]|uniref:Ricin B lectin domain-containing protein n=1 Tax=Absidia repens TaxID=90262 RepID=A0A1X2IEG7_9FUNG|nr:hypothetical protein BCR42DRAFT_452483 [Absidia repens]
MMTGRWAYITSPSRHNHVLTVVDASFEPQARVELRPNVQGTHQQWYMDRFGFIINKHSGCVLSVKTITKKRSIQDQSIMQARRKDMKDAKGQQWEWITSTESNRKKEQVDEHDKDSSSDSSNSSDSDSSNGCIYYLQLKAFSDYYLNDKDVPIFGADKIKWMVV